MTTPRHPIRISDLAARSKIDSARDAYGLTEADALAEHLNLPLDQVERVLLDLETSDPPDGLEEI